MPEFTLLNCTAAPDHSEHYVYGIKERSYASPEAAYDALAPSYDACYADPASQAENRALADMLRDELAAQSILDYGCGTGLLLDMFDIPPARYLGVDISDGMLEQARRKHPAYRFIKPDAVEELCFRPDVIVALFGVFNHLPVWTAALLFRNALQPHGRIILLNYTQQHRFNTSAVRDALAAVRDHRPTTARLLHLLEPHFSGLTAQGFGFHRTRHASLIRLESATLGRLWPDRAEYVLVRGNAR